MDGPSALGRSGSSLAGGRLPSMRSTAEAVRSRMGRRASSFSRLRRATWLSASMATEKPMAAYRYPLGTLKPKASASSEKPIIKRKPRHRTTTVGCALTKRVRGLEASSMMPMAMMTAIIMMAR
ncbi:hypothetical protein G6F68_020679 [Rhizopus microsporus]|nr:hypothetical protein G6F68_020679 [Rhizopus microsporus]